MSETTLIKNVNILSPNCESWKPLSSLLIKENIISEINPDEGALSPDVLRVSGEGQYLLPGLIEMHGHFYGRANTEMRSQHKGYCPLYLAGGITTVRTPGEFEPQKTYAWKLSNESGETIGPRIVTGGWYFDPKPSIIRWFEPSETIQEIQACFEERNKMSEFFKVYSSMPADWIKEVCRLGHAKGKKVYGHLGMSSTIEAIEAGLDGIEHGFFTIQEFHSKTAPTIDMDGLEKLDMDSDIVRHVQDVILEHDTAVTPTMITFMLHGSVYSDWIENQNAWRYLDSEAQKKQREQRKVFDDDQKAIDQQERLMEKQRRFVGDLFRRGARIFCGTDPSYPLIVPGSALVWEAANLVDCGIPSEAVLKMLTINAAKELGLDSSIGSITEGKAADLVLVEKDPLIDIHNLDSARLVWKSGRMFKSEDLRASAVGKIS